MSTGIMRISRLVLLWAGLAAVPVTPVSAFDPCAIVYYACEMGPGPFQGLILFECTQAVSCGEIAECASWSGCSYPSCDPTGSGWGGPIGSVWCIG